MKKVLSEKKIYNIFDFIKWFFLIFSHYITFILYALFFMLIAYLEFGIKIQDNFEKQKFVFLYIGLIAPFFNGLFHIIYLERGNINFKAVLWVHSLLIIIIVPIFGLVL